MTFGAPLAGKITAVHDPASDLLRRIGVVLIWLFLAIQLVQLVVNLVKAEGFGHVGAVLTFATWTWLGSRALVALRREGAMNDPAYWRTTALGYVVLAGAICCFLAARAATDEIKAVNLVFPGLVMTLALTSLWNARFRHRHRV